MQVIEFSYCGGHCDPFRVPPGMFIPQMAALRWVGVGLNLLYITRAGLDVKVVGYLALILCLISGQVGY